MPCQLCGQSPSRGRFCYLCIHRVLLAAKLCGVDPCKVNEAFIGRPPAEPVPYPPGSMAKIEAMRRRAERLESLFHEDDPRERD